VALLQWDWSGATPRQHPLLRGLRHADSYRHPDANRTGIDASRRAGCGVTIGTAPLRRTAHRIEQ